LLGRARRRVTGRFFDGLPGFSPSDPGGARVVAVVANQMKPRLRNVHEKPGQEILAIEGLSIETGGLLVAVSSDRPVEVQSLEGKRGPE
jgi:hypothetical protein